MNWRDLLTQRKDELAESLVTLARTYGQQIEFDETMLEADILPELPEDVVLKAYESDGSQFFQRNLKDVLAEQFKKVNQQEGLLLDRDRAAYFSFLVNIAREINDFDLATPLSHIYKRQLKTLKMSDINMRMDDVGKQAVLDILVYQGYLFGSDADVPSLDRLFYEVEDPMIRVEALKAMDRLLPENTVTHVPELFEDESFEADMVLFQLSQDDVFRKEFIQKASLTMPDALMAFLDRVAEFDENHVGSLREQAGKVQKKVGAFSVVETSNALEDLNIAYMSENRLRAYIDHEMSKKAPVDMERILVLAGEAPRHFMQRLSHAVSLNVIPLKKDLTEKDFPEDLSAKMQNYARFCGDLCLVSTQWVFEEIATSAFQKMRVSPEGHEKHLLDNSLYAMERIASIGLATPKDYWSRFYLNPLSPEKTRKFAFCGYARSVSEEVALEEAETLCKTQLFSHQEVMDCWTSLEEDGYALRREWKKRCENQLKPVLKDVQTLSKAAEKKKRPHLTLVPKN